MSAKTDPRCNKCGGQFSSGGIERRRLPLGFGFAPGSDKFQVDFIEIKSYIGFCMSCGDETPVEFSRRRGSRKPAGINRKIARAAALAEAHARK